MTNTSPEMSEGVKILYKGAIDNIIFLKRQQWIITNYALVVYAAIVALTKNAHPIEKTLLTILGGLAFFYATFCMIHTQMTLHKLRGSLFHIYQTHFTQEERDAFKLWKDRPPFHYTPGFIFGLLGANMLACATTIYLVWRTPFIFSQ